MNPNDLTVQDFFRYAAEGYAVSDAIILRRKAEAESPRRVISTDDVTDLKISLALDENIF